MYEQFIPLAITALGYSEFSITGTISSPSGINWFSGQQPADFNWDAVVAKATELANQKPLDDCKTEAKKLIAETDWSVLPDVNITNKADFEAYRATLRNYIVNPVANPVFPNVPQPVWG